MNKRTNQQLIKSAQGIMNGTDYRVVKRVSQYTDERGFPRREIFTAVEFVSADGQQRFIGEMFL